MPATSKHNPGGRVMSMAHMEKEHIIKAIETCKWQIEGKGGAASLLDLNPGTLRGRMRKYDIKRN
jgi:transcriptional regulator with GAF, ATPase, and Fis domain